MRTLGYRTHVLLALAAAFGVVVSLDRPWYGRPPAPADPADDAAIGTIQGPVESLTAAIARWVSDDSGTTGWDALGDWGLVLAALAALTAVAALACLLPAAQGVARELLRYGGLASFAIAGWKLLDSPGPNAALELRHGAFVAAAAALLALTSASAVAAAPRQRT